ncbi:DUF371 domain-containing protein [Caldisphaera sp.]|uniref:DUF371 domain-containing protein n=1 Tax=Caldisphaera sp. TaxID=2060322 RepID=UPI0025B9FAC6|nr:DUF371 domain-containing protein [Caldisphaera sp.]
MTIKADILSPFEYTSKWFVFKAYGHENVRATHRSTIEITKDNFLTTRGDCIIGIRSEASTKDFPQWLVEDIKNGSKIFVVFCTNNYCDSLIGYGDKDLILSHENKIIFRKSNYIEPATALIRSNKAAIDLSRKLIDDIKKSGEFTIMITSLKI